MPHVTEPGDARRIYLIGICGTAMASLAGMLQDRRYVVGGSDEHVYPPMSNLLQSLGIPILEGYTPDHLETFRPDLVVIGNAISRNNPEAVAVLERDLPYLSMPEALYQLFIRGRHSVVVAGTHGKTTTSSLMAWLLESAGRDPGMMIGGIPVNFGRSAKAGQGGIFVSEGDEYNTAFFDRGPKFLHYHPDILLLNNIEFDHADLFEDLDAVIQAFRLLLRQLPPASRVIANGDDPIVQALRDETPAAWTTFGRGGGCDVRVGEVSFSAEGSRFDLWWNGNRWGDLLSPLSGMHNVLNAAGCIAAARGLGLTEADLREGLRTFQGIRRRMEVRGVERGVIVIDDFAHHPTAIETTLAGARERYPGRRIWALYEPRSISSGRKEFEKDYARAFRQADRVIIGPIFHRARFETTYGIDQMMSVPALVEDLEQNGVLAEQVDDFDAIAETVASEAEEEDVVIAMSSGAFGGIHEKILDRLRGVALEPDR